MDQIGPKSSFITIHIGGNDLGFSDMARACIYRPAGFGYGNDYENDEDRSGSCAKQIDATRQTLTSFNLQVFDTLNKTLLHDNAKPQPELHVFVMGYVHFFNEDEDSPCNKETFELFPGIFGTHAPLTYKLRRDLNALVESLNNELKAAADAFQFSSDLPQGTHVHYVDISPQFNGHRFCDLKDGKLPDQYLSEDVWIWNLSAKDAEEITGPVQKLEDVELLLKRPDFFNQGESIIGPIRRYGKTRDRFIRSSRAMRGSMARCLMP